jgi:CRP/FNR family transcriptional regulator, anaerobic regulatory protein
MTDQIIQSIKNLVPLNDEEEKAFLQILAVKAFKKKEFLLQEGQICDSLFFVNSGCLRVFFNVEGVENTIQFFFANAWYTDFSSFLSQKPTIENLQALEPCSVIEIKKKDLYNLYETYPIFNKVGRVFTENAFLSVSNLNKMLTNEEPEQRYLNLFERRPEIVKNIPQHYIASYLGIKPETLSRIRKRISR